MVIQIYLFILIIIHTATQACKSELSVQVSVINTDILKEDNDINIPGIMATIQ